VWGGFHPHQHLDYNGIAFTLQDIFVFYLLDLTAKGLDIFVENTHVTLEPSTISVQDQIVPNRESKMANCGYPVSHDHTP